MGGNHTELAYLFLAPSIAVSACASVCVEKKTNHQTYKPKTFPPSPSHLKRRMNEGRQASDNFNQMHGLY